MNSVITPINTANIIPAPMSRIHQINIKLEPKTVGYNFFNLNQSSMDPLKVVSLNFMQNINSVITPINTVNIIPVPMLHIHPINIKYEPNTIGYNFFNVNQSSVAVLNNGHYEVNGFKFRENYYIKLWKSGRPASSLIATVILKNSNSIFHDSKIVGSQKIYLDNWEMVYCPVTKLVKHIQPIKKKFNKHPNLPASIA